MEQNRALTLGSLFDGSGGFPLGGLLTGIRPVWASEIEPFPVRVTTKRMPFMKHYGDVASMNGAELEPVDIITFGSPCQDMSIAGKRSGLDGSRSSLFYEAIRIVKEMRCATNGQYPKWICWENVTGAFSSNGGDDFKAVLEAVIGVIEPGTQVPMPEKGRWPYADCYMGEGWSVAYRTLDAQYWGVPQRRKRIYLVADFAGGSAWKVLFKSEGLSGYSHEGFRAWQGTSGRAEACPGATGFDGYNGDLTGAVAATLGVNCGMSSGRNGIVLNDQGGDRMAVTEDVTCTLRAEAHHPPCVMDVTVFENHSQDTRYRELDGIAPTVASTYGMGGNNQPFVVQTPKTLKIRSGCEGGGKGPLVQENKSATISCHNDQVAFVPFVKGTRPHSAVEGQTWKEGQIANTLNTYDIGEVRCNELAVQAFGICSADSEGMRSANPHVGFYEAETSRTLDGNGGNPACNQGGIAVVESPDVYAMTTGSYLQTVKNQSPTLMARDYKDPATVAYGIGQDALNQGKTAKFKPTIDADLSPTIVAKRPGAVAFDDGAPQYTIRRLTPTECARLQGFPDWWCADLGTDAPTEEEIQFWTNVFETHRRIMGTSSKPRSQSQIIKWLRKPHSDTAEYKMWGNGVALPCVCFVLAGIVFYSQ